MIVMAAALVLAYLGTFSMSQVREFAPLPANVLWLGVASVVCGVLLALTDAGAARLIVVAAALAVLIFGGLWSYIAWALLGQHFSLFELIRSDIVFLYVVRQGAVMFIASAPFGLLGAVAVRAFLPDRYLP